MNHAAAIHQPEITQDELDEAHLTICNDPGLIADAIGDAHEIARVEMNTSQHTMRRDELREFYEALGNVLLISEQTPVPQVLRDVERLQKNFTGIANHLSYIVAESNE